MVVSVNEEYVNLLEVDYSRVHFGKENKAYIFTTSPNPATCTVGYNICRYVSVSTHQLRQIRVMPNKIE